MTEERPFLDALREELLAAAARQVEAGRAIRPRPRILLTVVRLATIVALLVGGLVIVSLASPAKADVSIEIEGGRVTVTLLDLEHRPERIETAARSAGVNLSVVEVPVGPSLVGRFVRSALTGVLPPELQEVGANPTTSSFTGFSLPVDWQGRLQLDVGRPARSGEPYDVQSNAFAFGEPLACTGLLGATAALAIDGTTALELRATYDVRTGDGPVEHLNARTVRERGLLMWIVRGARAVSRERVVLDLAPPGAALPPSAAVESC